MNNNGKIRKYDYRCRTRDCNRLLFRAYIPDATMLDIRCPACGAMHRFTGTEREASVAIAVEVESGV